MNNKILGYCPICNDKLFVKELHCNNCNSSITGNFSLSEFDYLTKEERDFTLIFMKNAGNIKAIEKELNISYPTVKRLLGQVQEKLGFKTNVENEGFTRDEILSKLKNNEISFEKAEKMLKELGVDNND